MRALITGAVLGGQWRIIRPALGDEPHSECRVESTDTGVAGRLTLWRTRRAPTARELERFGHCLAAGGRTGHDAFAPVEDVGYDAARESLWLVRPWWNGESLPSMLGGLHPVGLDPPYLWALAEQLARALHTAHEAGWVHGRLRPSRVLVAPGPQGVRASVLDLGLEHFRREHARDWLKPPQVGTDALDPALDEEGPLTPAPDVFGYGCILRDMLLTRRDGAWKGCWERWVERATAPVPRARFADVREAWDALRPVLQSLPDPLPAPPENYQSEPVSV